MSNTIPVPPPQHRNWYDPFPRWLVIATPVVSTLICGFFTVLIHWDKVEAHGPQMWAATVRVWKGEPPQPAATAPTAPAPATPAEPPAQKKVEVVKPALPCIDAASDISLMLSRLGGDKNEAHFNKHFRGRDTCFILTLTDVGTRRLRFVTMTEGLLSPTFYVEPRTLSDLKRFKPGTRLRISGELVSYEDTEKGKPDGIYIERARLTEVSDADGSLTTGSVRK